MSGKILKQTKDKGFDGLHTVLRSLLSFQSGSLAVMDGWGASFVSWLLNTAYSTSSRSDPFDIHCKYILSDVQYKLYKSIKKKYAPQILDAWI